MSWGHIWDLSPENVREIVEAKVDYQTGRMITPSSYKLFGLECPQEVMAAYERLWATKGRGGRPQEDGDALIAWVISTTLLEGDFEKAVKFRDALETLGWRPRE